MIKLPQTNEMWSKDEISIIFFSKKIVIKNNVTVLIASTQNKSPIERWNPNSISSWEAQQIDNAKRKQKNKWIMILKQTLNIMFYFRCLWFYPRDYWMDQNKTIHKHNTNTANKNMRSKNSCNNSKQQKTLCIDEIKTLTHKTNHWKETES